MLNFINDTSDLVWVVDDVHLEAECLKLSLSPFLQWAEGFSRSFELSKGEVSTRKKDHPIWNTVETRADKLWSQTAHQSNCGGEFFLNISLLHAFSPLGAGRDGRFQNRSIGHLGA